MNMFDGATAALAIEERRQDRLERDYKTFGARAVEELIDDLLQNKSIATIRGIKVDLAYILDGEGFILDDEVARMFAMRCEERADYWDLVIEKRAKARVKAWIETSDIAAGVIAARIRECVMEAEE